MWKYNFKFHIYIIKVQNLVSIRRKERGTKNVYLSILPMSNNTRLIEIEKYYELK